MTTPTLNFNGKRVVFAASTGGHLTQLHRLAPAMRAADDSPWVTFDSEQSRSLLAHNHVEHLPYIRPRDHKGVLSSFVSFVRIYRATRPEAVVSTGAGIALSAFAAARLMRIPTFYIESVSRTDGPSLTGRIISTLRLAKTFTQHASWATPRWHIYPSVLTEFESVSAPRAESTAELSLFVTLGTIRPYRFDSLVDTVLASGLAGAKTVWQLGVTSRDDLPGTVLDYMPANEFQQACAAADLVITHSGVGTVINLLESGVYPIVVPRRSSRGEHVDDHQQLIADLLHRRDIACVREVDQLDATSMLAALEKRIRTRTARTP
jgi:UDP-N-acetylglucosamine--N-acetylmuramyl-(pentapeptide) pyrophosphoryl-undecaprenol N-acetylglucosamine transferase